MLYLALGGVLLVGYLWLTGGKVPLLKRREWRIVTAAWSLAAFTAAVLRRRKGRVGLGHRAGGRGPQAWRPRRAKPRRSPQPPPTSRMSDAEARRILGVGSDATTRARSRPPTPA